MHLARAEGRRPISKEADPVPVHRSHARMVMQSALKPNVKLHTGDSVLTAPMKLS